MKILCRVFLLIILSACSTFSKDQSLKSSIQIYSYQDGSGIYFYKRYVKKKQNKLIVKNLIYTNGNENLPLEKSITVSSLVPNKKAYRLLPQVSQFSVWFEKDKYFVQHKTDRKTKTLNSLKIMNSKKTRFQTKFPNSSSFCFFNQLPECLLVMGSLDLVLGSSQTFMLLWEASPYHNEQYSGFDEKIFYRSVVRREEDRNGNKRFSIEINGQVLFLEFSKENEFLSIYWIAQGITIQKIRGLN